MESQRKLDLIEGGLELLLASVKAGDPQNEIIWRIEEELRVVRLPTTPSPSSAPSETPATEQEPIAWQRRLMYDGKNWGRWHDCQEEMAQFAQQNGFPKGYHELKAEVRPLYAQPVAVADVRGKVIEECAKVADKQANLLLLDAAAHRGLSPTNDGIDLSYLHEQAGTAIQAVAEKIRALQQQAGR